MTEADLDELADRIVKMLTTTDFYEGMGNGVSELGKNFGYLAYGFIDTDSRSSRSREKERVIKAIHRGIVSRDKIIEAVTRIFDIFNRNVSEAKKETIYNKIAGGLVGSFIISQVVMRASKKIGNMKKMFTGIVYYGLMAGGMMDRSIYRSRSLKEQNPEVYSELRKDDLDLLFFLFEEQVEPLTEAIKMKRTYGIGMFNKLIDKVESRI
ncbi:MULTISPECIES: hypothetical protein [Pectobacteriaceae]|uniref:Uncharacterized protein n=1 Tax=Brenneria izbisi TaxID=2939450 RepID=A0AA41Y156_9GAMM|nr:MULTISPECIES: hypothetical protein [Pectobacteriaceae]KAA3667203.1 hypothetical protein FEV48_11850 [Pectobacterium carotovorum subsp. carotovorum]MCV9880631.1 hypothetical protein [Brenneria izbisi]MCV9884050.1 hypothetical protein [Brenneria izbisi]QQG30036.1 hypothetical protein JFY74_08440 [Pectobacterium carotovorum]